MAKKKAEDMRNELKNIISFTRGPSAWDELIKTEASIRKKRQKMIYDQQERRRKFIEVTLVILGALVITGFIIGVAYLVMLDRGLV